MYSYSHLKEITKHNSSVLKNRHVDVVLYKRRMPEISVTHTYNCDIQCGAPELYASCSGRDTVTNPLLL